MLPKMFSSTIPTSIGNSHKNGSKDFVTEDEDTATSMVSDSESYSFNRSYDVIMEGHNNPNGSFLMKDEEAH